MREPVTSSTGGAERDALGRARVTETRSGLVIEAPGRRSRGIPLPAALFGIPWFVGVAVLSVWYLGWGEVPESVWIRLLLWVVALALTHNLGTLAYLTIWTALYERIGTETLTIDPEYIVVVRRVGRFKREHRIRRKIIAVAEVLPPETRRPGRPRIEIKSWRAAIGFGGGLHEDEAQECARVIQDRFDRDEAAHHASEVARGFVGAEGPHPVERPVEDGDAGGTEYARTSVMQAYREALESRGSLRTRLGAIASVTRSRTGRRQDTPR